MYASPTPVRLVSSVPSVTNGAPVPRRSYVKLPTYLHRRGRCFYFKRKIPADLIDAFPGQRRQVWKSLDTQLLEKARVMLAVEVSEFDLTVATHRRARAAQIAGVVPTKSGNRSASSLFAGPKPAPSVEELERLALLRTLEENLEKLRAMTPGAGSPSSAPTVTLAPAQNRAVVPAQTPALQQSSPRVRGKIQPTMLHLFEDWKRKQTRHRTVNAVQMAVLEFREIHGPLAVENITRQHARDYRDQLIERRLSRSTIETRIGFLATLMRHGMVEVVEHLTANPFEKIDFTGAKGARPAKDRRAYSVAELNLLFASPLYTQGHRPKGQPVEAAYWTPLLGPFVGARIEELCQLRVEDVQCINGVWCLRLCDLDENQQLKNEGMFWVAGSSLPARNLLRQNPVGDVFQCCRVLRISEHLLLLATYGGANFA